jgi:Na+-transporting NADH:ubiquinone oxidoreductase subunit NqrD
VVAIGIVHNSLPSTVHTLKEIVTKEKIINNAMAVLAPKEYLVVTFIVWVFPLSQFQHQNFAQLD